MKRKGTSVRIPALCVSASLLAVAIANLGPIAKAEAIFADHLRHASPKQPTGAVQLVYVDENAIRRHGKFPFDRSELARALDFLNSAGAQRIHVDAGLTAPEDREGDAALEAALHRLGPQRVSLPVNLIGSATATPQVLQPLAQFSRHATLVASQFIFDGDNRVRRVSSLPDHGYALSVDWLKAPGQPARMTPLSIDFAFEPTTLPQFDIGEIVAGKIDARQFARRNVILGLKVATPQYTLASSGVSRLSRIEMLALASETLTAGQQLGILSTTQVILLVFLLSLGAAAMLAALPPMVGLGFAVAGGLIWTAGVDQLQRIAGVGLPITAPVLALLLLWPMLNYRDSRAERFVARLKAKWIGTGAQAIFAAADVIATPAAVFDASGKPLHANAAFTAAKIDGEGLKAMIADNASNADDLRFTQGANGSQRHFAISRRSIETLTGRLTLATFSDVTESARREDELSELAFTDRLTGLANRVAFHARMTAMGDKADSEPFGILIVDLDGFKLVNDSLGHHAGDQLLARVAQRILPLLRKRDLAARIGGDEFAILIASGEANASIRVADNLLRALTEPFEIDGAVAHVGASIGIALCPDHAADPSQAMKYADAAMYAAKKHKPAYAVHDESEIAVRRPAA